MTLAFISWLIYLYTNDKGKARLSNGRLIYYIKIEATLELILLLNIIFYLIFK